MHTRSMTGFPVDGAALTAQLARRLDAVVPRPLRVRVRAGAIWVEGPGGDLGGLGDLAMIAEQAPEADDGGPMVFLLHACRSALEEVQDMVVCDWLHEVWPAGPGHASEPPVPAGRVAVEGDALHLWYGAEDRTRAVLALPSIPLALVRRDAGPASGSA